MGSCSPCSNFSINTTLVATSKEICGKYGVRGSTFSPAVYTRQATFFGTVDRNRGSFRTVTVINGCGGNRCGRLYCPYNIYHRIVGRFYNNSFGVVLNSNGNRCRIRALSRLLPNKFSLQGRWLLGVNAGWFQGSRKRVFFTSFSWDIFYQQARVHCEAGASEHSGSSTYGGAHCLYYTQDCPQYSQDV